MSPAVRGRSARSRIREFLAQHGPVVNAGGRATAALKDAVGDEGSPLAFIQLVTAMDKAGEITRNIRGKRTYRIGDAAAGRSANAGDAVAGLALQYDDMARSLLRQAARARAAVDAAPAAAQPATTLDELRRAGTAAGRAGRLRAPAAGPRGCN